VLRDVPAAAYEVVASARGETARAPVTVTAGSTARVALVLAPGSETPSP
jgi:hypothetical protein